MNEVESAVYWITYSGDKHPQNYIGSSSVANIDNGYMGSTSSRKWKKIVDTEMTENPHLYSLKKIHITLNRSDATIMEREIQKMYNVVKSELFWNQAIAAPNGCFGMDTSGSNNSMFGRKSYKKPDGTYVMSLPEEAEEGWCLEGSKTGAKHYITSNGEHKVCRPKDAKKDWAEQGSNKNRVQYRKPDGSFTYALPEKANDEWIKEGPKKGKDGWEWFTKKDGTTTRCLPEDANDDWKSGRAQKGRRWFCRPDGTTKKCLPEDAEDDWVPGRIYLRK